MSEPDDIAIELAEGFDDDEVAILIDGEQVWQRAGVTTNYSVGIADVARVRAPSPDATVEVRVGSKASAQQRVDSAAASGEIRLRARIDPAGALALGTATDDVTY